MNVLSLILMLLQATPEIITAIKGVDGLIHGEKKGPTKKALLMAAFANAPTPMQDAASALIDTTVTVLKEGGELPSHGVPGQLPSGVDPNDGTQHARLPGKP